MDAFESWFEAIANKWVGQRFTLIRFILLYVAVAVVSTAFLYLIFAFFGWILGFSMD